MAGSLHEPGEQTGNDPDGLYLGDAIHFFLDSKRAGGRSERTVSEYRKKLDLFQRWAAARLCAEDEAVDVALSSIGADEVEAYVVHLRRRGLSDTSRKNHLSVIRSFFETLSRRLGATDPTRSLDEVRFHQKAPARSFLTAREADLLLGAIEGCAQHSANSSPQDKERPDPAEVAESTAEAAGPDPRGLARRRELARALAARDHAAFSAMIYAGLRIEECTALTVDDLCFEPGVEEIRVARGKGDKERVVPMGSRLGRSLRRYLDERDVLIAAENGSTDPHLFVTRKGTRVTEGTLRRRLYHWVRKSRLNKTGIKPHDLRRTFGTWYLQRNPGQLVELAQLMGHSDLSQVRKYALSDENRAREGVERL